MHQLNLSWGVIPFLLETTDNTEELLKSAVKHVADSGLVEKGDKVVVVTGSNVGESGGTNTVQVIEI